jgi:hypothetical protein
MAFPNNSGSSIIVLGHDNQGTYAAETTYTKGQEVYASGSTYVSKVDNNTGNTPSTSPTQWQILASKGDAGPAGTVTTENLTANRALADTDNGKDLVSSSTSNLSFSLDSGRTGNFGCALFQAGTGTVTLTIGAGVTTVDGESNYATIGKGEAISIVYVTTDTYIVRVG